MALVDVCDTCGHEYNAENKVLRQICKDLQWMARRYADGRMTYAVAMLNEHTETLLDLEVDLNSGAEKKIFARDGMEGFELPEHLIKLEEEYVER